MRVSPPARCNAVLHSHSSIMLESWIGLNPEFRKLHQIYITFYLVLHFKNIKFKLTELYLFWDLLPNLGLVTRNEKKNISKATSLSLVFTLMISVIITILF